MSTRKDRKESTDPEQQVSSCANYDRSYGGCSVWGGCLVEQGKHCDYFEKVVLSTAKEQ